MNRLGWKKDPPKMAGQRPDLQAEPILGDGPVPASASNRDLIVEVLDQGALGSCVANAILQAVRAAHVRQGIAAPQLGSRLFGYYVSRAYHHATALDDGTYLRYFFQGLRQFGFCPEKVWPYDVTQFASMPPADAYRASFDQHEPEPTVYSRISAAGTARLDMIRRAVALGYCVCFGTQVSEAFARNQLVGDPLPPPVDEVIAGGHALCVVGYDQSGFDIVNSWSADWGDGGFCRFSPDYLTWPETDDLWIVNSAPRYSE